MSKKEKKEATLTFRELVEMSGETAPAVAGTLANEGLQRDMEDGKPVMTLKKFKMKLEKFKTQEVK